MNDAPVPAANDDAAESLWLKRKEAAKLIGMSVRFLEERHRCGDGPPEDHGGRAVRYEKSKLIIWFRNYQQRRAA